MDNNNAGGYYDAIADIYDQLYPHESETESAVAVLSSLAGDVSGRLLELGAGTGRLALPLARMGMYVHAIEGSEEMAAKLRTKPGGNELPVTVGDFCTERVEGKFGVVYIVFNTMFCLLDAEAQIRCFQNMSDHLADGGAVVVEAYVPTVFHCGLAPMVQTQQLGADRLMIRTVYTDPTAQRLDAHHSLISSRGVDFYQESHRYSWPSELDLMARLAGLELSDRWGGWRGEPFGAGINHISVYRKQ